jgi:hypothetical protein
MLAQTQIQDDSIGFSSQKLLLCMLTLKLMLTLFVPDHGTLAVFLHRQSPSLKSGTEQFNTPQRRSCDGR